MTETENFLERAHKKIRSQTATFDSKIYYQTTGMVVDDLIGAQVFFLSIRDKDESGLQEGIYLRTNFTPEIFNACLLGYKVFEAVNKFFLEDDVLEYTNLP